MYRPNYPPSTTDQYIPKEYKQGNDSYNESPEYYENEFYQTNYNSKQSKYESNKYPKQDEMDKEDKQDMRQYQKYMDNRFFDDEEEKEEKGKYDDGGFYGEDDKFYDDKMEEREFYQGEEQDDQEEDQDDQDDQEEEKEGKEVDQKNTFFSGDDFKSTPYSMFSAFGNPDQDFSLFAPFNDNIFENHNPMRFDFLDNPNSNDVQDRRDDLFHRFDNLEELREKSENFKYDIANKDISTKIAQNKRS